MKRQILCEEPTNRTAMLRLGKQKEVTPSVFHPKVSIIIVNYNGAHFLEKLFSSLNDQTFRDFEVIFVDNLSRDNSLQITESFAANSSYIKVVALPSNQGFCKGNNVGLDYSNGEYIVLLNNDTYVSSTWLEHLVKVMDTDASIGACQSKIIDYVNKQVVLGNYFGVYGKAKSSNNLGGDGDIFTGLFYAAGTSVILRRSAIAEIGYLFDNKQFTGDMDLGWRLRLRGFNVVTSLSSVCHHFQGYSTRLFLKNQLNICFVLFEDTIRTFIRNYGTESLFKRSPLFFSFLSLMAFYETLVFKVPAMGSLVKAIVLNISSFKEVWLGHLKIQAMRKISDKEIEKSMLPYPSELFFLKLKLRPRLLHSH